LVEYESDIVDQGVDENINLDIFEMTINIRKSRKKLVNTKLLIFK
jgi:hypothetical protein